MGTGPLPRAFRRILMLKPLRLIAVGRLKTPFWKAAAAHYVERLARWRALAVSEVKDGDPALPVEQRKNQEGRAILAALAPRDIPFCLDEHGEALTSRALSRLLEALPANARPCFIVGGAYGLDPTVIAAGRRVLALGPLTLPHELARVVLLEQMYRAEAIARGIPYHHD